MRCKYKFPKSRLLACLIKVFIFDRDPQLCEPNWLTIFYNYFLMNFTEIRNRSVDFLYVILMFLSIFLCRLVRLNNSGMDQEKLGHKEFNIVDKDRNMD